MTGDNSTPEFKVGDAVITRYREGVVWYMGAQGPETRFDRVIGEVRIVQNPVARVPCHYLIRFQSGEYAWVKDWLTEAI